MSLKLSYRDKVIFIVVMIILVLVAGFFLFIKPKFEAVDSAKYTLEAKQTEKANIDAKIQTLPTIIESLKESAKTIEEKQKLFLDEGHPYVNETYIREILNDLDIEVVSMTTEYTKASDIKGYIVNNKNILAYKNKMDADLYNELPQEVYDQWNGVAKAGYPVANIGVTTMNVTFKSDIELNDAFDFIDRMAEDEKAVIINTVGSGAEATEGATNTNISATITMYSIFPLNVEKVLEETDEVKPLETTETPAA
ncbi:MAG: hypothetical protein IJZ61_08890 [Oscillospiraceae bacterium]|nr:hypothetical protein [Oscillospiraceae bacterium]